MLLAHFNSYDKSQPTSTLQNGKLHRGNFLNDLHHQPQYPGKQDEVNRVLMEGWAWLLSEGFLIPDTQDWCVLSRKALRISKPEDLEHYRKASLLPRGQLHPLIASKVYPAFLRGEYDTAVFQAFREVEITVRSAGNFPTETLGTDLMRQAFRPEDPKNANVTPGPLTDTALPVPEQKGMADLFSGAIALYKNPQSHRFVPTRAEEAVEIILFASQLLRIADRLRASSGP